MNDVENALSIINKKSNRYLKSVNAFDLMKNAASLQKDISNAINRYKLPISVIAGVLASEMYGILSEVDSMLVRNVIVETLQKRDEEIKSYVSKNFMRKEKL